MYLCINCFQIFFRTEFSVFLRFCHARKLWLLPALRARSKITSQYSEKKKKVMYSNTYQENNLGDVVWWIYKIASTSA